MKDALHFAIYFLYVYYAVNKHISQCSGVFKDDQRVDKCLLKINHVISSIATKQAVYLITESVKREVRTQWQPGVLHLPPQDLNQVQIRRVSR